MYHKTKTTRSLFTKTITNYQKVDWTSFKQHVKDFISFRQHSTNHTHSPIHIHKLIQCCNHIHKQNGSEQQIITLNNYINKQIHEHKANTWKKIDLEHNLHSLWGTIAKLSNKQQLTQQNRTEQKHLLQN